MSCRRHVAVVGIVILLLLVNRLLLTAWKDDDEDIVEKVVAVPYLPRDKVPSSQGEKPTQRAPANTATLSDGVLNRIRSNKNLIQESLKVSPDKPGKAVGSKGSGGSVLGDYTMYFKDIDKRDIQDKFVNKHEYVFTLNNKYACRGSVFVLVMIHSAPGKLRERQSIRDTWGSVRFYSGAVIVPMFLVGQVGESKIQEGLVAESKTYNDIIQGNFVDSYRNLTAKNIMGLHWIQQHCNNTKFILKTDDDTMVNIYHLINFLFLKSPDGDLNHFLYCSTYKNHGPRRDKMDKWYVPVEEYKYSKYPPYCEGFAYIMSYDVTKSLYDESRNVKPYWIDDVFVTGFLALKAGIYHKDMEKGHGYRLMESSQISKTVQSSMFILAKYEHLRKNWDRTWSDIKIVYKILD